jgi:hypothetical protein
MAINKKIEKELYGPSVTEVALGAILGLLLGVVVAGVYLVFKPVATVKVMPKEISRSTVYYIAGSDSSTKGKAWQAKQKLFVAGTAIQLNEDELNAWAAAGGTPAAPPKPVDKPKPAKPAKPGEKPKPEEKPADKPADKADAPAAPEGFIIPSVPNFRVVDDKLQIGMKCTLNWFGLTYDVVLIATGGFTKSGDQVVFSPSTLYLGSCPLHLLPAASGALTNYILGKQKVSDETRVAWTKLTGVTVEGGLVKFATQ